MRLRRWAVPEVTRTVFRWAFRTARQRGSIPMNWDSQLVFVIGCVTAFSAVHRATHGVEVHDACQSSGQRRQPGIMTSRTAHVR